MPQGDKRHNAGRRLIDQDKRYRPRHFLAIQASRHPVGVALLLAIAVALVPLVMVLDQQSTIRHTQHQIGGVYTQLQLSRRTTTFQFCTSINRNAVANNKTTDVITAYVLNATRSSRALEHIYRSLGLPPYKERLKQAKKLTNALILQKVPILNCHKLVRQIDQQLAAAGRPVRHKSPLPRLPGFTHDSHKANP